MDAVEEGARAAAGRLADQYSDKLANEVEAALRERDAVQERSADLISLGGLIVSIATLAWTVYRDLKEDRGAKPPVVMILESVRRRLDWEGDVEISQRSKVIDTTVEATVQAAERNES